MKTILVTGGAGFIGSNFIRRLCSQYEDYKIFVLDALTYAGRVANIPEEFIASERVEFWHGNVMHSDIVDALVSRSDVIIHFAAETHVTRSIYSNRQFFDTDVIGTHVVSNSVLKHRATVERFIHVSTSEVYGTSTTPLMNEDHPLNPSSPYASAKCGADRLVYSYWNTYQLPAVIIRPFNNFGPFQHLEKVVPRFITSCIMNEPMTVHGDGDAERDWLYVEDHCDALDRALHVPIESIAGQAINIGTGKATSILDIARIVAKEMGFGAEKIRFIADRPGQVVRHACDSARARNLLGWEPATSLLTGIRKTIDWYRNHPDWWSGQLSLRKIPIILADGKKVFH